MSTAAEQNAAGTPQLTLNGISSGRCSWRPLPHRSTLINTGEGLRRAAEQLAAASGPGG